MPDMTPFQAAQTQQIQPGQVAPGDIYGTNNQWGPGADTVTGPLAGLYGQTQVNDWRTAQDRANQQGDINTALMQSNLQNTLEQNKIEASKRDLTQKQLDLTKATYDNGSQGALLSSDIQSKIAKNLADMTDSEQKQVVNRASTWHSAEQAMDGAPPSQKDQMWKFWKGELTNAGVKNLPDDWSSETEAKVHGGASVARNTVEQYNKMQQIGLENKGRNEATAISASATIGAARIGADVQMAQPPALLAQAYRHWGTSELTQGEAQMVKDDIAKSYAGADKNNNIMLAGIKVEQAMTKLYEANKDGDKDKIKAAAELVEFTKQNLRWWQEGRSVPPSGGPATPATPAPNAAAAPTAPPGWNTMTDQQKQALGYEKVEGGWRKKK